MVSEHPYSAVSSASYKAERLSHRCVYHASIFDRKRTTLIGEPFLYYHAPICGERCTQRLRPRQARAYYTRLCLSRKAKVTEKEPGRPLLHPGSDYLAFVCLVITAQAVRPCKSYLAVLTCIFYLRYCATSKIKNSRDVSRRSGYLHIGYLVY